MSVEEELDLRDLVTQALELNGCLPRIRAQLRANLFLTLDESSKINKQPLLNRKIKSYLDAPEGQLMFGLVREFLEYFDLDFTASVYEPESYFGSFYKYEGRQKIIDDLGLKSLEEVVSGPLLLHIVKIAQMKTNTLKINLRNVNRDQKELNGANVDSPLQEQINGHCSPKQDSSISEETNENTENEIDTQYATFVKTDMENEDSYNSNSVKDETSDRLDNDTSKKSEDETSPESKSRSKSDKLKTKLDLSPLQLNKGLKNDLLPSLYKKSSKEFDFEIKDDYEEDFMSGSELESKTDSPNSLSKELQQSAILSAGSDLTFLRSVNSPGNDINSSTTDIKTNLSIENSDT